MLRTDRQKRGLTYKPATLGAEYGGDLFTPSMVKVEQKTVDNAIAALARDVFASTVSDAFKSDYLAFVNEWQEFYDSNSGILSRVLNTTYATTLEFRDRYNSWRQKFVVEGGNPSTPALAPSNAIFGGQSKWLAVITVGAALAGLAWLAFRRSENEQ